MIIDRDGNLVKDHPVNQNTEFAEPTPRDIVNIAERMRAVVPDCHKEKLDKFLFSISFVAPESRGDPYFWGELANTVDGMVPRPDFLKLSKIWQVKVVALLTNRTEEFVKKHFSKDELDKEEYKCTL